MHDLDTYQRLAVRELAGMPDGDLCNLAALIVAIAFCDSLGQLATWGPDYDPEGFTAWVRCHPDHVGALRSRDFDVIRRLPHEELTRGSVLFVAETWTRVPRAAAVAAHELARLPGVETICAFVWGGRPKVRRWRERAVLKAAA